jgi:hypothetical protein
VKKTVWNVSEKLSVLMGIIFSSWIGQERSLVRWEHVSHITFPHFIKTTGRSLVNVLKHTIQNGSHFVLSFCCSSGDFRCIPFLNKSRLLLVLCSVAYTQKDIKTKSQRKKIFRDNKEQQHTMEFNSLMRWVSIFSTSGGVRGPSWFPVSWP